jgi:hypothetical protein
VYLNPGVAGQINPPGIFCPRILHTPGYILS